MDLSKLPFFSAVAGRFSWLGQRHQLLAENIAHADTPGFRPHDLKPVGFDDLLAEAHAGVTLRRTSANHVAGAQGLNGHAQFRGERQEGNYEIAPSGNAVVLEEQVIKVAENAMEHQLATNLYRKHINLIRLALGRQPR